MSIKSSLILGFFVPSMIFAQWVRVPQIPESRTVYSLLALHDTLYAGTDSVLYVGRAGGTQWSSGTLPFASQDFISCLFQYKGTLLAGSFHNGVSFTTDLGVSWRPFSAGLAGLGAMDISSLQVRRDTLIAATLGASVFAAPADLAHPWSPWGDSLADYEGDNVFKMIVVGNSVLAGAGGNGYMFRYSDAQPWWNPIPLNNPRHIGQFVSWIASNDSVVLAGTNFGIYRSTDEGGSWERRTPAISPNTVQIILLPHAKTFFALATTPFSTPLFASTDNGESWNSLGDLPFASVLDAATVGDTMFLGLTGGMWRAPLSSLTTAIHEDAEVPLSFQLYQNYPNPFNPTTVIRYQVPAANGVEGSGSSHVRLVVYDLLGREVEVLANERKPAGSYKVSFDAAGLSSGVYIYRLTAGPFVKSRKMIMMR